MSLLITLQSCSLFIRTWMLSLILVQKDLHLIHFCWVNSNPSGTYWNVEHKIVKRIVCLELSGCHQANSNRLTELVLSILSIWPLYSHHFNVCWSGRSQLSLKSSTVYPKQCSVDVSVNKHASDPFLLNQFRLIPRLKLFSR